MATLIEYSPGQFFDKDILEMYLSKGLSFGMGRTGGYVCVEAAICLSLGLPINDKPPCVDPILIGLKIELNDQKGWGTAKARGEGMRRLAYAQLGTRDVLDFKKFSKDLNDLVKIRFGFNCYDTFYMLWRVRDLKGTGMNVQQRLAVFAELAVEALGKQGFTPEKNGYIE